MIPPETKPSGSSADGSTSQHVEAMISEIEVPRSTNENGEAKRNIGQEQKVQRPSGGLFLWKRLSSWCFANFDEWFDFLVVLDLPVPGVLRWDNNVEFGTEPE